MRIRHLVCTDNFAGVERYVASTAAELARRGHDVEVIGGDPRRMHDAFRSVPVSHVAEASVVGVARANLRRPRPDLVHAHMTSADVAAVLTRPLVRCPLVSTLHFAHPRGHSPATRRIYGALRPFLTAEIAISQAVADANGGKTEVIHNGITPPDEAIAHESRRPVVLVVQRLEPEKHSDTAIEAFALAELAESGWELHFAGRGAEQSALERLAATRGIAESVRFLGQIDDVDRRMATASIMLAPTGNEGFGLAVVEAMAHGLPVIAADGGGHRETVGSATPEMLFPTGNAQAAADLLADLAAHPDKRHELGQRNAAAYVASFTIAAHVDQLEALYRRIVSA